MKLLVVSDTHGKADLNGIVTVSEGVSMIVHLGDGFQDGQLLQAALRAPLVQVAGNADYPLALIPEKMFEANGKQVYITHGHLYDVKKGLENLYVRAAEIEADLVLFGHLHRRVMRIVGKTTYFCPASAWKNYDETPPCAGIVDLSVSPPACRWVNLPGQA